MGLSAWFVIACYENNSQFRCWSFLPNLLHDCLPLYPLWCAQAFITTGWKPISRSFQVLPVLLSVLGILTDIVKKFSCRRAPPAEVYFSSYYNWRGGKVGVIVSHIIGMPSLSWKFIMLGFFVSFHQIPCVTYDARKFWAFLSLIYLAPVVVTFVYTVFLVCLATGL